MTDFRVLDAGPLTAAENMALDGIILEEVAAGASPPTLRFLQFSPPGALVGYHQDVSLEIREDYCREHGIDINRRHTGGGGILFQESGLGWELFGVPGAEPFVGTFERILEQICTAAASGIARLGVPAAFRPRNDIEVDGRKISGTGGTAISGGMMFQGTLLVRNEVEAFLKALRVPVEKLKKREIESLKERICFLEELVHPCPSLEAIKTAFREAFSEELGVKFVPGPLTIAEQRRLVEEIGFYASRDWVYARSRPSWEGKPIRSLVRTDGGMLRVHLWPSPGGRRVQQALIAGDFFTVPKRLIHDLEAALVGVRLNRPALEEAVRDFFFAHSGEILGVDPAGVAAAIAGVADRKALIGDEFSVDEVNELFLVNLHPGELRYHAVRWLLLPYCSKSLACPYRKVPGCDECGSCEIGDAYAIAHSYRVEPLTVQSFEHLMEVLQTRCAEPDGMYVGSCCEAFYAKHQKELESVAARGVLVNLDSTTCYDLGKYGDAYRGRFDTKTSLNCELIDKTLRLLHAGS